MCATSSSRVPRRTRKAQRLDRGRASQRRPGAFELPDDIRAVLEARGEAWTFFRSTSPAYQRIRAAYLDNARDRPDEFRKRLQNLVEVGQRQAVWLRHRRVLLISH